MNVGEVCKRNVVTVRPFDALGAAAKLMRDKQVGYLVVVKAAYEDRQLRPVGVLTDRDIVVGAMARDVDVKSLRVEDVMTRHPVVVPAHEPLEAALPKMRKAAVRRVPVVGYRGELVGVMSFDDVFHIIAEDMQNIMGAIRGENAA
jgi:CBS domain-containing protein